MAHIISLSVEQEMEFLLGWATQTIAFCLSLRPECGAIAEYETLQKPDTSRANAIALELWRDALAQCGESIGEGAGENYLLNVFTWCERNLSTP